MNLNEVHLPNTQLAVTHAVTRELLVWDGGACILGQSKSLANSYRSGVHPWHGCMGTLGASFGPRMILFPSNEARHRMSGDNVNLKSGHRSTPLIGALV